LGIPLDKMAIIFEQLKDMLTNIGDVMAQLRILLTTTPIHDRIKMIGVRMEDIRSKMEDDEIMNILGNAVQELDISKGAKDPEGYKKNIISLMSLEEILAKETKPSLKKMHDQTWIKVAVPAVFNLEYTK
jgi:hypothetical protein